MRIPTTKKHQTENDSELEDVTNEYVAAENELLPKSYKDEEERIRSTKMKAYRERRFQ